MKEYVGAENIMDADIWMASDDFAYYTRYADGCYYILGAGFPDKPNAGLHASTLEINEDCLEVSIGLMSFLTMKSLTE